MLSDLMPTLQNFAIEVLSEDAHELRPRTDGKVTRAYLQVFSVQGPNSQPFAKLPGAALIADAIAAVRNGLTADDALNAVTLTAGLALARGRSAARVSRRRVSDAPGARASRLAARSVCCIPTSRGCCSSCSPRAFRF